MTITLDLPTEIEEALQAEAARRGIAPHQVVMDALAARLRTGAADAPYLPRDEADLLQQINLGFSAEWWERYNTLKEERASARLTGTEQQELIQMSDELERANVLRVRSLIALAERRGTTLETVIDQLGVGAPPYD